MFKPSFYLFLASAVAMLITESVWLAPLVALFAAFTLHGLLDRAPPAPPMGELGIDEEDQHLEKRLAQFRKALHD